MCIGLIWIQCLIIVFFKIEDNLNFQILLKYLENSSPTEFGLIIYLWSLILEQNCSTIEHLAIPEHVCVNCYFLSDDIIIKVFLQECNISKIHDCFLMQIKNTSFLNLWIFLLCYLVGELIIQKFVLLWGIGEACFTNLWSIYILNNRLKKI